jgi:two-component system sensor histidine kinase TctE
MIREMLLGALLSELFIAAMAIALLWYGVGRGLEPLEALRDEIAARSPQDLRAVTTADKPAELAPIVSALNGLLSQLQSAIERQQRFISNAAHQLRTPLSGLKMHAELARREPSSTEMRDLLDMISGETDRTVRLVNQLLTLARAEPDPATASMSDPVNLHELGNRSVQEWLGRAVHKGIDLGFELEDAWTTGDSLLLRELLANLIDNAVAYTPSGGHITVRTTERNGNAIVEVEDSGRGIPEAERDRVMERFYRTQGTPGEGSGLGLAIVAEIASRHGARVEILSASGGAGTLVRASFPALKRRQIATGKPAVTPADETVPNSR